MVKTVFFLNFFSFKTVSPCASGNGAKTGKVKKPQKNLIYQMPYKNISKIYLSVSDSKHKTILKDISESSY